LLLAVGTCKGEEMITLCNDTRIHRIADLLHEKFCWTTNHVEHCGWYYGTWNPEEGSMAIVNEDREKWYENAVILIDEFGIDYVEHICDQITKGDAAIKLLNNLGEKIDGYNFRNQTKGEK
jgi:hypothetical protein